jgi:drug/metabolite transporter, DME family
VQLVHHSTGLSPVGIGFYRLAIAATATLFVVARRPRALAAAIRAAPGTMVLIGVGLGTYQALYFEAVARSGVAVATVVSLGLAPGLSTAWESVRAGRWPGRSRQWSLVAAVAGLVLISGLGPSPTPATPQPLLGIVAAAGSGAGYAATTILSRHVADRMAPFELTGVSSAVGALVLLPVAVRDGGVAVAFRLGSIGLLVYLGVVTTAVAYALFYAGLRTVSGGAATILTLLEPLTATVLAVLVLDEPLSVPLLAGSGLLLGAVGAVGRTPAA